MPASVLVPYLLLTTGIFTLAELIHAPTSNALAAAVSPEALRGRYLAAFQFSWATASFVAPGFFTLMFAIDPALPWAVVGTLALLAALSIMWLKGRLPPGAGVPMGRSTAGCGYRRTVASQAGTTTPSAMDPAHRRVREPGVSDRLRSLATSRIRRHLASPTRFATTFGSGGWESRRSGEDLYPSILTFGGCPSTRSGNTIEGDPMEGDQGMLLEKNTVILRTGGIGRPWSSWARVPSAPASLSPIGHRAGGVLR